jgi:hypothetical protein
VFNNYRLNSFRSTSKWCFSEQSIQPGIQKIRLPSKSRRVTLLIQRWAEISNRFD